MKWDKVGAEEGKEAKGEIIVASLRQNKHDLGNSMNVRGGKNIILRI